MRRIEQQIQARLETAASASHFKSPAQMRDLKMIRKKFGVAYFVEPRDAMVFAKGKGFKVINRSGDVQENELDFFYEVTDKSGNTVGLISGSGSEGEGYICPTSVAYKRWAAYQQSQVQ